MYEKRALRMLTCGVVLGALALAGACATHRDVAMKSKAQVTQSARDDQNPPVTYESVMADKLDTETHATTQTTTTSTTTRTAEAEETPVPGSTLIGSMRGPTRVLKPVRTVPNKMGQIIF